jgi:hypothetical protein
VELHLHLRIALQSCRRRRRWPNRACRNSRRRGGTALLGPTGLAPETIGTLNRIVNEYLSSEEGKQALLNFAMEPLGGTPEDLAGFMTCELTKWRPVAEKMTPQ